MPTEEELFVKRFVFLSARVLLVVLLVALGGCRKALKPMRMNNMMARGNNQLAEAAKKFATAVSPLGNGQPADVSKAQDALSEIKGALAQLHKDFDNAKAVSNSEPAKDLLEKYRSFLATEDSIVTNCFEPMLAAAKNNSLSDGDKWETIQPLLKKAGTDEAKVRSDLVKAQEEFAKHHNFDPRQ
jgi:hypothetical protein